MEKENNNIMRTTSYAIRPSTGDRLKQHKENDEDKTWDVFFNELLDIYEKNKKQRKEN